MRDRANPSDKSRLDDWVQPLPMREFKTPEIHPSAPTAKETTLWLRSKYQEELSANRPITVRDLPEILTTVTQIVADALIFAKTTRYTDFDLDQFHQECEERQDHHLTDLLRKLLKVPPDSSKQHSPGPSVERDQNHCHQRQKLL